MSVLCIATAAALVTLPVQSFTIAWTHSIEKVRWEEDYRVVDDAIIAGEARVQGSAAGMEPPPGATLRGGWWHYVPAQARHAELRLTRSPYAADYDICTDGHCQSLAAVAPQRDGVTRLYPCRQP